MDRERLYASFGARRTSPSNTGSRTRRRACPQNDFEEPLPIGALDGYLDKFEAFYHYRPFLTEILAEPLVGRLKREIDRKTFTVLPLGRVRNKKESTKQTPFTTNMALFLGADQVPISERPVDDNHLAVYLCKVLWEGSWAVAGNFEHTDGSQFASLQACKTYVREFAEAATPLGRPHPPLVKVLAADEDTQGPLCCIVAERPLPGPSNQKQRREEGLPCGSGRAVTRQRKRRLRQTPPSKRLARSPCL